MHNTTNRRGAPTKEQQGKIEKETMLAYNNIMAGSKAIIEARKLGIKPQTLSQRFRNRNLKVRKNDIKYDVKIKNPVQVKYKGYNFLVNRQGDCVIMNSVSSCGRKLKSRKLVFYKKAGYMQASLNRDGKVHTILHHRLIASAFCKNFSD